MPTSSRRNPISAKGVERGIRLRSDGSYEVRVHVARDPVTGRQRQVSRVVRGGIRAARAERAKLLAEANTGQHGGTKATFGYLLDAWNGQREKMGRAPTTLHEDRRKIDTAIRPALGSVSLAKLRSEHLDRFYADQLAAGTSAATVRKYHAIIRAALRMGEKWGWVRSPNPAALASPPTAVPKHFVAPASATVLDLIREAEKGHSGYLAGIVMFGALSGLRPGELCALRFSDVDWGEGKVTVRHSVWQAGSRSGVKDTKTHLTRDVLVDDRAMEVLRRRHERWRAACVAANSGTLPDAYVWSLDPLGTTHLLPRSVSSAFIRVRKKLGVDVRLYDLRHYAGTEMIAAGVNPKLVQEQLGHADIATTMRFYVTGREEGKRAAAEALGKTLAPPKPKRTRARKALPTVP